jgi:shikimate dehydrogenase
MTAKYAVIGDPVEHSLSPAMQNAAFSALGIDATFEAIRIAPPELEDAIRRFRSEYAGFNVTTPLKEAVIPHLDAVTDVAREVDAANTVRIEKGRMTGHNTDGLGFIEAISDCWHITPRGKSVCVLGSGPAARAMALALDRTGAATIACWSRNPLTAAEIGAAPATRPDLLVSALPADAVIPDDVLEAIAGATYVFDVNYRAARSPVPDTIGVHRSDGLPLLLHQGALAFHWWTGLPPPLDAMRSALADPR